MLQENFPKVSIVIPTKNSGKFLEKCLDSIKSQTYQNIEIIVVDNNSFDSTKEIAKKYTDKVFEITNHLPLNKGEIKRGSIKPERSSQVNYGVEKSKGEFVYKVDADFVLDKNVVAQCLEKIKQGYDAVVVHNTPDETVSWLAKIRKFEIDMYKYNLTHSSARFVKKEVFQTIGGFNETITAGEDYDFQNKLNRAGYKNGFIEAEAIHLGEPTSFWRHMKKYYEYGKDFLNYKTRNPQEAEKQLRFFRNVYLKNWKKFLHHPLLGIGFIIYNFFKFGFGGMGYLVGKIRNL